MSDANYQPLTDPATEARNGEITRYVGGVGLVILLYDLIITMKQEVSGSNHKCIPLLYST
jgi:hypothetical protein